MYNRYHPRDALKMFKNKLPLNNNFRLNNCTK